MARGAESKSKVTDMILNTFEGAFLNGKELRIPMIENGERVEIKVALTCAKTNVVAETQSEEVADPEVQIVHEPTEEEKDNLQKLMASMF